MNRTENPVDWIISVEKRAEMVYRKAQVLFHDDPALSGLLGELAADEAGHYRLVNELKTGAGLVTIVPDDLKARGATEAALSWFEHRVSSGLISRSEMMEAAAALEFSEHNELFIYLVNSLRGFPMEFSDLLVMLRAHRRRLTGFLEENPEFSRALALTRSIPELAKERDILVVEDEEALSGLLRVFLAEEGTIDSAANGAEALAMLEKKDYAAIISDVDMPVMNGIELFVKAEERWRGIGRKFLFLTGSFEEEFMGFFKNRCLRYLFKPVSMSEIRKALSPILEEYDSPGPPVRLK